MNNNNKGVLVAKRAAYSALIIAGVIGLFMGLSYWLNNTTSLDWRVWAFIGFWAVALVVDTIRFAARNTLSHTSIRYGDSETGQDRLEAILQASGYEMDHVEGDKVFYTPTIYAGTMNRPVVVDRKSRHAVIDGPSFVINHLEERIENLNYVDMSVGEAMSAPLGTSTEDYNAKAGLGSTGAEYVNPKTA